MLSKGPRQNTISKGSKVLPKQFEDLRQLISRAIAGPRGPKNLAAAIDID